MTWRTHAIIGANAAWIGVNSQTSFNTAMMLLALGAFSALLPDIDAGAAKIHYLGKGILSPFRNIASHRGFFHSLLAIGILLLFLLILLWEFGLLIPFVVAIGYASHPFIDGFNTRGVAYLYPNKKPIHLLPRALQSKVGGWMDQLLFAMGFIGVLFYTLIQFNAQSGQSLLWSIY